MLPTEHYFETRRLVRYYLLGETGPQVETLFFALHGYGFLARYFAKKFEGMDLSKTLVVVPEGLHRYYLDPQNKRVGASWMTKEDRLTDIEDQVIYLDGVLKKIKSACPNSKRTVVFGFSQGTATASRWVSKSVNAFDDLVLWAGALPPDLNSNEIEKIKEMDLYTAIGDKDEYIDPARSAAEEERLNTLVLAPKMIRFDGAHDIPRSALEELTGSLGI